MAEDKKGFILYADQKELFEQLPNDKAGELIKHIYKYVNDEDPKTDDILINLAFTSIKQQLKRDLKKFKEKIDKKSISGREGNLKRWNLDIYKLYKDGTYTLKDAENIANGRKVSHSDKVPSQSIANIAVKDTVNVTVIDTVKEKDILYIKNDLFKSNQWKESITRIYNCKLIEVEKYLTIFLDEQEIDGNLNRELKEIKTHFRSWFKLQPFKKNISKEPHIPRIAL